MDSLFLIYVNQYHACASLLSCACHMLCPSHLSFFFLNNTASSEEHTSWNILYPAFTPPLWGPDIFLSTLFSKALGLCSSLTATDQISHPYKTTGRITVLYVSIFKCHNIKTCIQERTLWNTELIWTTTLTTRNGSTSWRESRQRNYKCLTKVDPQEIKYS